MSYIIGTRVRPGDRAAMVQAWGEVTRPKLMAAGALRVNGLEWLTGDGNGLWTGASEWESLHDGFAALEAFYADPEVVSALAATSVEVVGRIVAVVEATAGELDGAYMGITAFSIASPDPARIQASADLALEAGGPAGLKGVRVARMFAAGPRTNSYIGAVVFDNIDAYPESAAATTTALAEHYAALGATVVDRLIVKMH